MKEGISMHYFTAVIHKNKEALGEFVAHQCDEETGIWDYCYANNMSRFCFTIPVGKRVKEVIPLREGRTFYNNHYGRECDLVPSARIRNIDLDTLVSMMHQTDLNILQPYSYFLLDPQATDNIYEEEELQEVAHNFGVEPWEHMMRILQHPRYQNWFITAIDYHV